MRAVVVERFGEVPVVREVPDPACPPGGVVVAVAATGLCRSDWHGWMGHDSDVVLPHVPGHEFAGTVVAAGPLVRRVRAGERVTAPFVCACGRCASCRAGDAQVCEAQQQPGFTYWGSFAEYVVVPEADLNVVPLPGDLPFAAAAGLGCRFATAYRAVLVHGRPGPGDWLAVHGCGGVGLAAVMIGIAAGARVVAHDPDPHARERAAELGAVTVAEPGSIADVTGGGAHVSVDAIGGPDSVLASVAGLRRRGRHVQVGLLGGAPTIPARVLDLAVARELELAGSHGMAARDYPAMLARVASGELDPGRLVTGHIGLDEVPERLAGLGSASVSGVTVIEP